VKNIFNLHFGNAFYRFYSATICFGLDCMSVDSKYVNTSPRMRTGIHTVNTINCAKNIIGVVEKPLALSADVCKIYLRNRNA